MTTDINFDSVTMKFGNFVAVKNINLTIRGGEFFSFLGPSGCGKTTLLRLVSGFAKPSEGIIRVGETDMGDIGPNKRPTAMIFQSLALFPLMSVAENIAFGLRVRGMSKSDRRRRADELLDFVALEGQGDKLVSELSGGQRQRVAVARALAVQPEVLLLDEPLSALDLKLRQHMRAELRAIQKKTGVTFIYITHDQGEALTMSDRVAVMSDGVIEQVDTPANIYRNPATRFVAEFVGENNPFNGVISKISGDYVVADTGFGQIRAKNIRGLAKGDSTIIFVRPEVCKITTCSEFDNTITRKIKRLDLEGSYVNLFVEGEGDRDLIVHLTNDQDFSFLAPGVETAIGFGADDAVALPTDRADCRPNDPVPLSGAN